MNHTLPIDSTEADNKKLEDFRRLRSEQADGLSELSLAILRDKKASRNLKVEAINQLATAGPTENIKALANHLQKEDDLVAKSKIVRILGERGDESNILILDKITGVDTTSAKSIIAYRYGLSNHLLPQVKVVDYKGRMKRNFKISTRTLNKTEKSKLKEDHSNPIPVHTVPDVELTCQRQVIHIHRTKTITEKYDWKKLVDTPQIPFQIYFNHYSTQTGMPSHYLMTHPAKGRNKIHINIIRLSGRQMYSGTGELKEGKFYFSVATVVDSSMPPIKLQGEYDPTSKKFNFTEAYSAIDVKNGERRVPTPID